MTYYERPNIGRKLTENGQIPEDDLPKLVKSRLATSRNVKRGFDERFLLVVSHNFTNLVVIFWNLTILG
jgi:hypothetical protein